MSLDLLNTDSVEPAPRVFIKGQTLEFLMELPKTVPAGFFETEGVSTVLTSELQLEGQSGEEGGREGSIAGAF